MDWFAMHSDWPHKKESYNFSSPKYFFIFSALQYKNRILTSTHQSPERTISSARGAAPGTGLDILSVPRSNQDPCTSLSGTQCSKRKSTKLFWSTDGSFRSICFIIYSGMTWNIPGRACLALTQQFQKFTSFNFPLLKTDLAHRRCFWI